MGTPRRSATSFRLVPVVVVDGVNPAVAVDEGMPVEGRAWLLVPETALVGGVRLNEGGPPELPLFVARGVVVVVTGNVMVVARPVAEGAATVVGTGSSAG